LERDDACLRPIPTRAGPVSALDDALPLRNGVATRAGDLPLFSAERFRSRVIEATAGGARVAALFGDRLAEGGTRLTAVLARDDAGALYALQAELHSDSYPSLTPECPEVHLFEREIAETLAVRPEGHPWLKPVRFTSRQTMPGVTEFFRVEGEQVHEVAVGPVHAGVIEPGHFRFQCDGERVLHLEIALGYQHRGVARALVQGPEKRRLHYAETLAGDTTAGHAAAYCQAVEALAGVSVPPRALGLRGVALELERLANHTGDLGALAGDVGYLPTASYCGRMRGDWLNATAELCGSRFGRSALRPGGVGFDLDEARIASLSERLATTSRELRPAVELLWDAPSVLARFDAAGPVPQAAARALGLVGVAARASGLERDVRVQLPSGIYQYAQIPISTWRAGDVFARAYVRWLEIQRSTAFVTDRLAALPRGPVRAEVGPLRPDSFVVSLVEGWRGEICHVAASDREGRLAGYQIVDPSFHNWTGLALAMRDQPISDFPLCNKSFNLSYCGFDL
jgi:Ni,Fe-hydrogenase III large subunit